MLSILIPTFNYNVTPLVEELSKQVIDCGITYEILVIDDGSLSASNSKNKSINNLNNCTFESLKTNIGRSAIRNLLAKKAQYNLLIFIDAGTFPKHNNLINRYLTFKNKNVVCGGMTQLENPPKKPYKLRWLYTKKREFKTLCSSNFMINKDIFFSNPFDETLKKYGCEDVLFFSELADKKTEILFINNPVTHNADDDANRFIKKTEDAIRNLIVLIQDKKINSNKYIISEIYSVLHKLRLSFLVAKIFVFFKPALLKNFNSSYPSIFLYDFYRLGYFCLIKTKQ
ncbi:glycosyltransferase family A protein [uncultured Algibacter sp.]|uniref:glycosyltransferase family 2 protein n=1 Tax=uncultured Algibacter sp. TaxID=298659 RepID=UPI002608DBE6|nr:glycosyltransferase family A protein [uncultured Algibacter sp.]